MASKEIYGFVGGIILAIIAAAGLLAILGLIFGLIPGQQDSNTPFEELTERIVELEPGDAGASYNYFIGDDKILVAFSKGKKEAARATRFLSTNIDKYTRPEPTDQCGPTNACLCLCDQGAQDSCNALGAKCIQFPHINNIGGIVLGSEGQELIRDKEEIFIEGPTKVILQMNLDENSDLIIQIPQES